MDSAIPKQYLPLAGRPVLAHTLERLASHSALAGIVVALGEDDPWWPTLSLTLAVPLHTVQGGAERVHSVLAGLQWLENRADPADWVLVHDAARPCLRPTDLEQLVTALAEHPVGGLLALPVSDTMKRTDYQGNIQETVSRTHLWRALTPQMFRLGMLRHALEKALAQGWLPTDEAAAMELAGYSPRVVAGHPDNLKITYPHDLSLAGLFLQEQAGEPTG